MNTLPPPAKKTPRPSKSTGLRDAVKTREKILKHATREIASKGFDGARVDRIAERCQVSKNTLYYHFGSKDALFTAVLERIYEILRGKQGELNVPFEDPLVAISEVARMTFWAFARNPEIIRLLNEENLQRGQHVKKSLYIRSLYDPLLEVVQKIIDKGKADGVFRDDLDPVYIYISISSMAYHFLSNCYTLQFTLDRDLSSSEAHNTWAEHVGQAARAICCKVPVADSK